MWACLMGAMLAAVAWGQGSGSGLAPREDGPRVPPQGEMRNMPSDIAPRDADFKFRQEMQNLDLEQRKIELEKERQGLATWEGRQHCGHRGAHGLVAGFLGLAVVLHILLSVWVYQDIRKRNAGSGIWIVVTLLAGVMGALLYALVRLGDKKE